MTQRLMQTIIYDAFNNPWQYQFGDMYGHKTTLRRIDDIMKVSRGTAGFGRKR